ncbi:hypothetical protein A0J61_11617, partial [Choanephora cucurbitarum]
MWQGLSNGLRRYLGMKQVLFGDHAQELTCKSIPNAILAEGNASMHRSKSAETWKTAHGIAKTEWPDQSLNLSPVENL